MKTIILLLLLGLNSVSVAGGIDIVGLRIYGNDDEYQPPIIAKGERITIEFDVTTPLAPNLHIIFRHASKDWQIDENQFVNDPVKIRADQLNYVAAPNGVYLYTYRYKNSFPNTRNDVSFFFSGNYIFTIVDRDDKDRVLAEGKFIVTEEIVPVSVTIANANHPGSILANDQVNFITVVVDAPREYRADDPESIHHFDIKVVDVIQNWKIDQPYRIDLEKRTIDTFVEDFSMPKKKFWIRNVPVGNEYRRLDLSNTTTYPNRQKAVLTGGPDVSRYQWQAKPDANGGSKLRPFTGANSDYLEVEMRLRLPEPAAKNIYLVGGFNNWKTMPNYRMQYDSVSQLYFFRHWLRRGVYDYQYVLGRETKEHGITDQDWVSLEGNDWRTSNRYNILVYYHDRRFGGFDRIVGTVRGRSPGANASDTISFP